MYVSPGKQFAVGVPKKLPPLPDGWTLRTSQFDYPAMIDPAGIEWLIAGDGALHEVKTMPDCSRAFTGRTQNTENHPHESQN